MPKNFMKKVGLMTQNNFQQLQKYLGDGYVLEYDGDKITEEKMPKKKHGHQKVNLKICRFLKVNTQKRPSPNPNQQKSRNRFLTEFLAKTLGIFWKNCKGLSYQRSFVCVQFSFWCLSCLYFIKLISFSTWNLFRFFSVTISVYFSFLLYDFVLVHYEI